MMKVKKSVYLNGSIKNNKNLWYSGGVRIQILYIEIVY